MFHFARHRAFPRQTDTKTITSLADANVNGYENKGDAKNNNNKKDFQYILTVTIIYYIIHTQAYLNIQFVVCESGMFSCELFFAFVDRTVMTDRQEGWEVQTDMQGGESKRGCC